MRRHDHEKPIPTVNVDLAMHALAESKSNLDLGLHELSSRGDILHIQEMKGSNDELASANLIVSEAERFRFTGGKIIDHLAIVWIAENDLSNQEQPERESQ